MLKGLATVFITGCSIIFGGLACCGGDIQALPGANEFIVTRQTNAVIGAETQRFELTGGFADVVPEMRIPANVKHSTIISSDAQSYVLLTVAPNDDLFLTASTRTDVGVPEKIGTLQAPPASIANVYSGDVDSTAISKVVYGWTLDDAAERRAEVTMTEVAEAPFAHTPSQAFGAVGSKVNELTRFFTKAI